MNRYILEGIASDLASGADIVVIVPRYTTVPNIFHQIMEYADEEYTQARISQESIFHESGGRVTAVHSRDPRGLQSRHPSVIVAPYGAEFDFRRQRLLGVEIIEY